MFENIGNIGNIGKIENNWVVNMVILVLIFLAAGITIYIFNKSSESGSTEEETAKKLKKVDDEEADESFIGKKVVEGLDVQGPKKNEQLEVINHYMAGSFNSCFIDVLNSASLDTLKSVLKKGIRCLDFEIYMEKNKEGNKMPPNIAIVGSSLEKISKKSDITRCSSKSDPVMGTKYPKDTVKLKEVFNVIGTEGMAGHVYQNYPIFINLRIKTAKPEIYKLLADDIKDSELVKKDLVLNILKYGKCGKFINNEEKHIKYQELLGEELKGKVIIMVEDWCKNYEDSEFYEYVHMAAGKNINVKTNDDLATKQIPEAEQKNTFSIVKPDDYFQGQKEMTQPSLFNCKSNGINILYWNYLCAKCVDPVSKVANLGNKENIEKDKKKRGFKGFFESNVVIPKPDNKRWKLAANISRDIKPKGLACEGTGACLYMGQNPAKPGPKFSPEDCEKNTRVFYDGEMCDKGKDKKWEG